MKILAVIFAVIAVIGLARFLGGIEPHNTGVFLCPAAVSLLCIILDLRKRKKR